MVAPPSFLSTPKRPPIGGFNDFQNRIMNNSAALTHPPSWEPSGYQNRTVTPLSQTHNVAISQFYDHSTSYQNQPSDQPYLPPANACSTNQHYKSFEMWTKSQIDGADMPPQHQSNSMPGYNYFQTNSHFGNIANMQMDNDFFSPFPYFDEADTSTQHGLDGAHFNLGFHNFDSCSQ